MTVANPLLDFSGLPRFEAIRPEHVAPALDVLLAEAESAVSTAEQVQPVRWETFVAPLTMPPSGCGAPGAWSATCRAWSTPRNCVRPTTATCRG